VIAGGVTGVASLVEGYTMLPVFTLGGAANLKIWLPSILNAAMYVPAMAGDTTHVAGVTYAVPLILSDSGVNL